jgi:hypothetical protein
MAQRASCAEAPRLLAKGTGRSTDALKGMTEMTDGANPARKVCSTCPRRSSWPPPSSVPPDPVELEGGPSRPLTELERQSLGHTGSATSAGVLTVTREDETLPTSGTPGRRVGRHGWEPQGDIRINGNAEQWGAWPRPR